MTRREWVQLGVGAATVASLAGLGGLVAGQILPPPYKMTGEVRDTIQYTKFPTPQWWNTKAGTPVKVSDFQQWQGATGVWRGLFQDTTYVPGTGYPCMIIRIKRESQFFTEPPADQVPDDFKRLQASDPAFKLYFDDPALDAANGGTRIVVLFDRCVHLCCYPGWHVISNPPPDRNYVVPPPTYVQLAENPVYCICHGSQYDPLLLIVDVNPKNDALYVGAERVHGPAPRALPVIPVKAQGQNLVGGMADPAWYIYCRGEKDVDNGGHPARHGAFEPRLDQVAGAHR